MNITKETVTHMIEALDAQNAPSKNEDGSCYYRHPDGLKCAIGHIIKDEFYYDRFEGDGAYNTVVREAVEESLGIALSSDDLDLLSFLQSSHDEHWYPEDETFSELVTRRRQETSSANLLFTDIGL